MDLTPCAVVLARSRTSSARIQRVAHRSFRDDQHAVRHEYAFLVPGSFETTCHQYGQARYWRSTRAEFHQVGAYPQLWAGKTPSQMHCRIFRFCAGWLERVMQAIAEAAWLLQSNRWAFGIFGPRYFSDTSFEARGGGPVHQGGRVTQPDTRGFASYASGPRMRVSARAPAT